MSEPSPPPPPGPIDCSTSPNDPSCKTTPGGPVDCNTNPNDLSCGPQPPVDCKTKPDDPSCTTPPPIDCKANPNDPSCKPDCTKNPDEPSCKVDCTTNPNDPSCPTTPPCQSSVIGISCPPVDCTKNPDDPSCPPKHIDCPERVGFTLRAIENGKCVYDPIKCKQDEQLVNNKCSPSGPDESCLFHPEQDKCKADQGGKCPTGFFLNDDEHCVPDKPCPKGFEHHAGDETDACYPKPPICPPLEGGGCGPIKCPKDQHFDTKQNKCVPNNCPKDYHFDYMQNKCVPTDLPLRCAPGFHLQNGVCIKDPICPPGYHLENKVCTRTIIKHVTTVETVIRNFVTSNQPTFLLLLDTAQLCQLAGDTQCVAKQNQFDTLNLVTKLDSTGKTWTITGQVEN
ncbi:MAG: hypothetical protein ACJ71K_18900, partial [Nitrososphaeraceae archaeon]